MITKICKLDLDELMQLLLAIDPTIYVQKIALLSDATIGQHVRHILEFYACIVNRSKKDVINYDWRERSISIESDKSVAINLIEELQSKFLQIESDQSLILIGDFSITGNHKATFSTSLYRELAYSMEHSIHHKAFIKVGLLLCGYEHLIGKHFGVAQSTIRNRRSIS